MRCRTLFLTYGESLAVHGANGDAPVVRRVLCQLRYISCNLAILISFTFPVEFLDICSEILEIGNYELVSECSCDKDNVFFQNLLKRCLIQAQTLQGSHAASASMNFSQIRHHFLKLVKSRPVSATSRAIFVFEALLSTYLRLSNLESVVVLLQTGLKEGIEEFSDRDIILLVPEHVKEDVLNVRWLCVSAKNKLSRYSEIPGVWLITSGALLTRSWEGCRGSLGAREPPAYPFSAFALPSRNSSSGMKIRFACE